MSSELMIEMKNVHKWFGELHVLNDINLEINKGKRLLFVVHPDLANQHLLDASID